VYGFDVSTSVQLRDIVKRLRRMVIGYFYIIEGCLRIFLDIARYPGI